MQHQGLEIFAVVFDVLLAYIPMILGVVFGIILSMLLPIFIATKLKIIIIHDIGIIQDWYYWKNE